jgi:hypothetical protein
MKSNFVNRTGMGGGLSVADEIEKRLSSAGMLPRKKIPRSTLNRLLSAETFRNRVGVTVNKGQFEFTHDEPMALRTLRKITEDLANGDVTLNDVWDVDGKRAYLDRLETEGLLPTAAHSLSNKEQHMPGAVTRASRTTAKARSASE